MYLRRSGIVERELPTELILYDPEGDRAFLLNRVSAAIWDMCDGRQSAEQMAAEIADLFAEASDTVLEDVTRTIARLVDDGLVTVALH